MNCTSDNSDYFQALEQASEAGAAEEEAVGDDDKWVYTSIGSMEGNCGCLVIYL